MGLFSRIWRIQMRKSTVAIISVLCTIIICVGIFGLYIGVNDGTPNENEVESNIEKKYKYEKASRIFLNQKNDSDNKKILSEDIAASSMLYDTYVVIFKSDRVTARVAEKYYKTRYEAELKQTANISEIVVKCDDEKAAAEICNLLTDEFCEAVSAIVNTDCKVIEYAN